jgi:hypothetical protein
LQLCRSDYEKVSGGKLEVQMKNGESPIGRQQPNTLLLQYLWIKEKWFESTWAQSITKER